MTSRATPPMSGGTSSIPSAGGSRRERRDLCTKMWHYVVTRTDTITTRGACRLLA
ncbi:hypothetical protein RR48_08635 [Papilio machaon]|uniref:Uncharacterized protein n=1 Tax=Papilio machaon TaxID=76193 RepID=A0A194RD35_PAPMA|nr:hypothetical protein RR48_08635 [Papilio machaon]